MKNDWMITLNNTCLYRGDETLMRQIFDYITCDIDTLREIYESVSKEDLEAQIKQYPKPSEGEVLLTEIHAKHILS